MCEGSSTAQLDEVIWNTKQVQKAAGVSLCSGKQNMA